MDGPTKDKIDNMTYQEMLELHRYAETGHEYFVGETGAYFAEIMAKKREEVGDAGHVAASKNIGWDNE